MKKYFVVVLAALFVLGSAASSFAIHADIPAESQAVVATGATQITISGDIRVRGLMDNNTLDFNSSQKNTGDDAKWDQRVRLSVEAKVTPNTIGKITLEAGNSTDRTGNDVRVWGTETSGATGTIQLGDAKQDSMRVLEAWILHTGTGLLGVPALVKIGHMPIQIDGLFYSHTKFGDDALLLGVDPIKDMHLIAGTVKLAESTPKASDANGYTLIGSYDIDKDSSIGLDVTYADAQNQPIFIYNVFNAIGVFGAGTDIHLWNFAVNGKTRIGGLGIKLELDKQFGSVVDIPGAAEMKARGYAGKLDLDYKINPVTLMASAAYGSGDDFQKWVTPANLFAAGDHKIRNFITTQDNIQHFTLVYEYFTPNAAGNISGGLQNTWFLNLGAKADLMKSLDGMINVYYLRAVHETFLAMLLRTNTGNSELSDKYIGTEVDVNLNYKIDKNLKYYVEGGYLFAGNFWKNVTPTTGAGATLRAKNPDDAWVLRHGIQLSF